MSAKRASDGLTWELIDAMPIDEAIVHARMMVDDRRQTEPGGLKVLAKLQPEIVRRQEAPKRQKKAEGYVRAKLAEPSRSHLIDELARDKGRLGRFLQEVEFALGEDRR